MSLKVKVSNDDTTAKHLADAITAGANVTITVNNEGGNEYIEIAATGGGGGGDADAIHDNVAGEIHAVTAKATPVGADEVLAEDSASSWAKKRMTLTSIFANITAALASAANAIKSATTSVDTSAATAPSSGQALIATGASAATWQGLAGKDSSAFHSTVVAEINALSAVTVADDDEFLLEDTSASSAKKKVLAKNMMAGYVRSGTTTIDLLSATAPSAGQALIATSSTAATWQTLTGSLPKFCLLSITTTALSNGAIVDFDTISDQDSSNGFSVSSAGVVTPPSGTFLVVCGAQFTHTVAQTTDLTLYTKAAGGTPTTGDTLLGFAAALHSTNNATANSSIPVALGIAAFDGTKTLAVIQGTASAGSWNNTRSWLMFLQLAAT